MPITSARLRLSNPFAAPHAGPGEESERLLRAVAILTTDGVTNAQLLLPFPQYCGVGQVNAPVGQSLYNACRSTYNHRVSKGLTALVSYTYSKFLDNVEGNNVLVVQLTGLLGRHHCEQLQHGRRKERGRGRCSAGAGGQLHHINSRSVAAELSVQE